MDCWPDRVVKIGEILCSDHSGSAEQGRRKDGRTWPSNAGYILRDPGARPENGRALNHMAWGIKTTWRQYL